MIITGATGRLGRAVAETPVGRVPANRVGVSALAPKKAAGRPPGVHDRALVATAVVVIGTSRA